MARVLVVLTVLIYRTTKHVALVNVFIGACVREFLHQLVIQKRLKDYDIIVASTLVETKENGKWIHHL